MASGDKYWFINHQIYLNIVQDSSGDLVSPTEVKTVRIHVKALYPEITVVDTSDLLLPIEFEDVLTEGMKSEVYEMTGDMKSAVFYKQEFNRLLRDMCAEVARGKKSMHTMRNYDL